MATQLTLRKGTKIQNDAFTGAEAELTYVSTSKGLRIHDGSTQGGIEVPTAATADYVIESQAPTAENNYTWYRKYKSGWVEQGGYSSNAGQGNTRTVTITLPVTMANTNYQISRTADKGGNANDPGARWLSGVNANTRTTTTFQFFTDSQGYVAGDFWEVKGFAA